MPSSPSLALAALGLACGTAIAQAPAVPAEFPPDAATLEPAALQQQLTGKVFRVTTAAGAVWRLQFQDGGYFYINVGSYADSGKWRIEGSALCTDPQKGKASCNPMRRTGESLYMKRDSGEVVQFQPQ